MHNKARKNTVSPKDTMPAAPPRSISTENMKSCEPWLWAMSCSAYQEVCAYCLKKHKVLQTCLECRMHRYCSTDCQTADWKREHETECSVLKIFKPHDWMHGCESSNDWIIQIMMWKLASKLKHNVVSQLPGLKDKSVFEILDGFEEDARRSRIQVRLQDTGDGSAAGLRALAWTMAAFGLQRPAVGFFECLRILMGNVTGAMYPHSDNRLVFAALYSLPPQRATLPVSWDSNLTTGKLGRCMVIHAVRKPKGWFKVLVRIVFYGILGYIAYKVYRLILSGLIALF